MKEAILEIQFSSAQTVDDHQLFALLKPSLYKDGNQWCCLYGDNIQEGIAGFGKTPYKAVLAFNVEWYGHNPKRHETT